MTNRKPAGSPDHNKTARSPKRQPRSKSRGPGPTTKCSVCSRKPVEARGLCHACYQKWRAGAPFDAPLTRTPKGLYTHCTRSGCDDPHTAKGLCRRHYLRQLAGRPLEGARARGERHGKAKLTAAAVRKIRKLSSQGASAARLGDMFGVSGDAVRDVIRGRTWKHVPHVHTDR
jgi:hypothetical protein